MHCEEIEGLLVHQASGGLSPEEEKAVAKHLKGCEACTAAKLEVAAALEGLESWEQPAPGPDLAHRTVAALTAELSKRASFGQVLVELWDQLNNMKVTPFRAAWVGVAGLVLYAGLMNIDHRDVRAASPAITCQGNARSIGRAVERFRLDHEGRLPSDLGELIPDYYMRVPNCPRAGFDTYTEGFDVAENGSSFTIVCHGHHHENEGKKPNFPRYDSGELGEP